MKWIPLLAAHVEVVKWIILEREGTRNDSINNWSTKVNNYLKFSYSDELSRWCLEWHRAGKGKVGKSCELPIRGRTTKRERMWDMQWMAFVADKRKLIIPPSPASRTFSHKVSKSIKRSFQCSRVFLSLESYTAIYLTSRLSRKSERLP